MANKYLEKIAEMQSSGQISMNQSSGASNSNAIGGAVGGKGKGFKSLRMGQHTTPDDLMPNPQKMDIRVK